MAGKSAFQEDLARYGGRVPWGDRALWSIGVYRLGRAILGIQNGVIRRLLLLPFLVFARWIETVNKIGLPAFAQIGGGLRITRCGMIFIHADTVIGRGCTLSQGVTIGNSTMDGPAPIVGDDVEFGAYAQVLGGIRIGDGAKIASMAVVLADVPPKGFAIGIPAKVLTGSDAVAARSAAL